MDRKPRIMLAPMEGITDEPMRKILSGLGGYDRCVSEFLRVTDHLYPERVFRKNCPELESGGMTDSGTPVFVQLLGSDHNAMAANARKAVELGAPGIDLNFGCPAKTVNRHGGGSALLKTPERVEQIVAAVRNSVPAPVPVTAKMRLGYENTDGAVDTAMRIERAGATELCVHARTKVDGYKPPARWELVHEICGAVSIPVIINGEIWAAADAMRAREYSGCVDVMLGRGALASPALAQQIASAYHNAQTPLLPWHQVLALLTQLLASAHDLPPRYAGNRTKQWLTYLRLIYPAAETLFEKIKRLRNVDEMAAVLAESADNIATGT